MFCICCLLMVWFIGVWSDFDVFVNGYDDDVYFIMVFVFLDGLECIKEKEEVDIYMY